MKNITVSVPDDVYRRARIRAAERDTSVSALVREFLLSIGDTVPPKSPSETVEAIRTTNPDFSATDRLNRDQIHDRDALRREYDGALRDSRKTRERG